MLFLFDPQAMHSWRLRNNNQPGIGDPKEVRSCTRGTWGNMTGHPKPLVHGLWMIVDRQSLLGLPFRHKRCWQKQVFRVF